MRVTLLLVISLAIGVMFACAQEMDDVGVVRATSVYDDDGVNRTTTTRAGGTAGDFDKTNDLMNGIIRTSYSALPDGTGFTNDRQDKTW